MNSTVSGHVVEWNNGDYKIVSADVCIEASQQTGVWLVDGNVDGDADGNPCFRMIVGVHTPKDAARMYARHVKSLGHILPAAFRVFPLASLEPIALSGVVDADGDEAWSVFSDAWVEIRL